MKMAMHLIKAAAIPAALLVTVIGGSVACVDRDGVGALCTTLVAAYEWQTLLAGLTTGALALFAAFITVDAIRDQIAAARKDAQEQLGVLKGQANEPIRASCAVFVDAIAQWRDVASQLQMLNPEMISDDQRRDLGQLIAQYPEGGVTTERNVVVGSFPELHEAFGKYFEGCLILEGYLRYDRKAFSAREIKAAAMAVFDCGDKISGAMYFALPLLRKGLTIGEIHEDWLRHKKVLGKITPD